MGIPRDAPQCAGKKLAMSVGTNRVTMANQFMFAFVRRLVGTTANTKHADPILR